MRKIVFGAMVGAALAVSAETKVGIIGLDTSHAIAFTKIMNVDRDPGVKGFRMVAAYQWGSKDIVSATNRYPKYLVQMKEMGVEIVPSIDELLAKVDCVCLETNDGREHLWQAEKVFRAGKPVFIDKPLAHNLHDAVRIYDLAKELGAKYFSSSALRYGKVVQAARAGTYGPIRTVAITSPSPLEEQGTHNYYSWYGIHGFEPYVTVMGTGAVKVSCFRSDKDDVINVAYADGRMGQLHLLRDAWSYSGFVMPEKPYKDQPVIVTDGYPGYEPLLKDIVKFFRTGKVPFPPEETLEIFALMEAAEMSAKRGGAPVTLAEALEAAAMPAEVAHRIEVRKAIENPATRQQAAEAALADRDPLIRRHAFTVCAGLCREDHEKTAALVKRFMSDEEPCVRALAKAVNRREGTLYRDNQPFSLSADNDYGEKCHQKVAVKDGEFSFTAPVPKHEAIELRFGKPSRDLYVWLNDIYLGQFDADLDGGRQFRLDATKETKLEGPNRVVVRDAAGQEVKVKITAEVLSWRF